MKTIVLGLFALLLITTQAWSWNKPQKKVTSTSDDFKSYIMALYDGLGLASILKPTADCSAASDDALTYAAAGIDNYADKNYWEGTLNMSDYLGALSPVVRKCTKSVDNMNKFIDNYPKQFKSLTDFFIQFGLNALGNIKPLIDRYVFVRNDLSQKWNLTAAIETIGEIISIHFTINPIIKNPLKTDRVEIIEAEPVEYTWANPLAPTPINPKIWNVFESLYNLLVDSKFISEKNLVQCEGGLINMIHTIQWKKTSKKSSNELEASGYTVDYMSVLDSFAFLHQSIEGCTYTLIEMGHRSELIDKEVFGNPSVIWKNIVSNVFELISDGLFGYAEYYYQDVISFFAAVGDTFYRVITYRIDKP